MTNTDISSTDNGGSADTTSLTIYDMGMFTIGYPVSVEISEDLLGNPCIDDKDGDYSIQYGNYYGSDVDSSRETMAAFKEGDGYINVSYTTTTLGNMTDVTFFQYGSYD